MHWHDARIVGAIWVRACENQKSDQPFLRRWIPNNLVRRSWIAGIMYRLGAASIGGAYVCSRLNQRRCHSRLDGRGCKMKQGVTGIKLVRNLFRQEFRLEPDMSRKLR